MKRAATYIVWLFALIVGLWHLEWAMRAMFVFGNQEPLSRWILVLAGPGSTLPAVLVWSVMPRTATAWLVLAGLIAGSLGVMIFGVEAVASLRGFSVRCTLPMWVIAGVLEWARRWARA